MPQGCPGGRILVGYQGGYRGGTQGVRGGYPSGTPGDAPVVAPLEGVQGSQNYMVQNERELHGSRKVVVVGSRRFSIRLVLEKYFSHKTKIISFCGFVGFWGAVPGGFPGGGFGRFLGPGIT